MTPQDPRDTERLPIPDPPPLPSLPTRAWTDSTPPGASDVPVGVDAGEPSGPPRRQTLSVPPRRDDLARRALEEATEARSARTGPPDEPIPRS